MSGIIQRQQACSRIRTLSARRTAARTRDQVIAAEVMAKRKLTPAQVGQFWRSQAFAFVKIIRLIICGCWAASFCYFLPKRNTPYDIDLLLQRDWKRRLDVNPFWLICPLALAGMVFGAYQSAGNGVSRHHDLEPVDLYADFLLTDRHRATILPFLIIYESCALVWLVGQARLKRIKPVLAAVGLLIVFAMIFRPQKYGAGAGRVLSRYKIGGGL